MLASEDQPDRDGDSPGDSPRRRDLCRLYKVGDAEQACLMTIAREAKQQGWWAKFDDLAIESLIGLEIEAERISSHEAAIVSLAFRTEQYARAVTNGIFPRVDDRILSERVISSVQSPVVFVESLAGDLYIERDAEIERYREALEHLRACGLRENQIY